MFFAILMTHVDNKYGMVAHVWLRHVVQRVERQDLPCIFAGQTNCDAVTGRIS